ncbi:hypothetical protein DPM13_00655 [Paracoccus mutanolyticus]|uniref:Uncharacterized protein n=1 Tax=Paracoccus mutanolyticus TaxID=1499308 RepID=A0ABM6WP60_9RHOB|nr:DUF1007 family protein [Paracoccus mutanolyticus]AWX92302.1 hypothetical protein DPM13_00655 [Paracoccus mutanolyticus]
MARIASHRRRGLRRSRRRGCSGAAVALHSTETRCARSQRPGRGRADAHRPVPRPGSTRGAHNPVTARKTKPSLCRPGPDPGGHRGKDGIEAQVYDPTYYTFYDLAGAPRINGRDDCRVQIEKADIAAAQRKYGDELAKLTNDEIMDQGKYPDVGGDFADDMRLELREDCDTVLEPGGRLEEPLITIPDHRQARRLSEPPPGDRGDRQAHITGFPLTGLSQDG